MSTVISELERDKDGALPAYAWPGGYPIFYVDGYNCILCATCATEGLSDEIKLFQPATFGVNWEGDTLTCDQCSTEIESAYGEVENDSIGG